MKHLLYASDVVPSSGMGGGVIVDRHLRRLADEGWTITVLVPRGKIGADGPWRSLRIPARQWWWPPFRSRIAILADLNAMALRRALRGQGLSRESVTAVATVCWGATSWFAASVARAWRCPLTVLVHDWWAEGGSVAEARVGERVCRAADRIFVVSTEMRTALAAFGPQKIDVLYPLPAERTGAFATWREEFAPSPTVVHVGTLHGYHVPYLTMLAETLRPLNGRLIVVCPADNQALARLRQQVSNLEHREFFPKNADAVRWVAERASALTIMYDQDRGENGSPLTGFPSRFAEFAQLGLPMVLAAPANNPLRSWARRAAWTAQLDPDDSVRAAEICRALTVPAAWSQLAADTRAAAENDFNPERLHRQFVSGLSRRHRAATRRDRRVRSNGTFDETA